MSSSSTPGGAESARVAALVSAQRLQWALQRNDRATIVKLARELADLRAPLGDQWLAVADILAEKGELTLMRQALDLFVEAAGGIPIAKFQKAAQLAQADAWREAYDLLCTLPDNVPDIGGNAYSRGISLLNLGRPQEAGEHLERALRARPELGSAWLALALSTNLVDRPEVGERIIAAERQMVNAPSLERAPYYHALGMVYADRGEHARAFTAFAEGAREMRALVAYDQDQDRARAAEAVNGYNAENIAALASRQSEATAQTIFISGLPRSGTTLVQQILTSHSAVEGGAEINRLNLLAQEVGGASYAPLARYIDKAGTAPAARLWHHWLRERFPGSGRMVDKTVNTSRMLGLAAALLPEAPLVWVTRDPLDRAWSCFRTNFSGEALAWSSDLEDIAFHFRLEDRLLAQWQEILGDRLLVVSYEDLVSDPLPRIRQILRHCGLTEEPQVFAPHENRNPVTTSSLMQVRRPINRDAIGAAEPYHEFLQPFTAAYYA